MTEVAILTRPPLTDAQLNALFAAAWPVYVARKFGPVLARSLAYCGAFEGEALVGFVNVAGDGGAHAFLLDPTVHPTYQRRGLGLALVRRAVELARASGAEWLHVDYVADLAPFYAAAGFRPTSAALLRLAEQASTLDARPPNVALQLTNERVRDPGTRSHLDQIVGQLRPDGFAAELGRQVAPEQRRHAASDATARPNVAAVQAVPVSGA